jgi:hypothetical protein
MTFKLSIPDSLYERAKSIAENQSRPVEEILLAQLEYLALLPEDEQAELNALRSLSDDTLWTIAAEQLPESVKARMESLMDANSRGTISETDYAELEAFVERGNRLMVRKAEASGILMERGHEFSQEDFKRRHE